MQPILPTIVIRHKKENLQKCSLRGLESRPDFRFYTYPLSEIPPLNGYILLTLDAPPLSAVDSSHGLLLIDATWRYADKIEQQLQPLFAGLVHRSLPGHYRTAYPRRQADCIDPTRGLASIEALYLAYDLLGFDTAGLLDHYYWKRDFLEINKKA